MWLASGTDSMRTESSPDRRVARIALAVTFAAWGSLATGPRATAQTIVSSQISGVVMDPTGLPVADAAVALTDRGTGAARLARSGNDGFYTFVGIPAGEYALRVESRGFKVHAQSGIAIHVGVNPRIDVALELGAQTEQVTVTAEAPLVGVRGVGVGQVIDEQRIVDLPLNGRSVYQLVALAGAAVSGPPVSTRQYPSNAVFSVAGGQRTATNFLLDGVSNMDTDGNFGLPTPFPDAVREFKVETSALSAAYGFHSGGAVNVVTKSGTNALRGDVFEFVRHHALNARNAFSPTTDSLKRQQFGGVVGGPVIRNTLHFFAGYQRTHSTSAPTTSTAFVATPEVLAGDFTQFLSPACNAGRQIAARAPFVGNRLSPQLFDPVAVKLLGLLPVSDDPCGRLQYGSPSRSDEHQWIGRMDWQVNAQKMVFGRWFVADYDLPPYYKDNLLTANAIGLSDRAQSGVIGYNHVLGGSALASLRAGYARSSVTRRPADGIPTPTDLGSNVYSPVPRYMGQFGVNGYFSVAGIPGTFENDTTHLSGELNVPRGTHQMSVGGSWIYTRLNGLGPFQQNPRFTFNGSITGNAFTDFIVGAPASLQQGNAQIAYDRMNVPSLFAQDEWRLSRSATVSAGVRWDPFFPQHNIRGLATTFDAEKFAQGVHSRMFTNAPAGVFFPGDPGFPGHSNTFQHLANVAPRLGLVLDPRARGREVLRIGYGTFFESNYTWLMQQIPLNPPWGSTIVINTPPGGLSNPWLGYAGGNPFPTPNPVPSNVSFPVGGVYKFMPTHVTPPSVQQWNVTLEKQVGNDWRVAASYLGNRTSHLWLSHEVNPAVYIPGDCVAGQYGLTANGACSTLANTNQRRMLYLANPTEGQYFGSVSMVDDGGIASYSGLLLTLQHRFSRGLSLLSNYTLSRCISEGDQTNSGDITNQYQDPGNRRAERGPCVLDRRQVFNTSIIARGPSFQSGPLKIVASDWQVAAIFTASTGAPLTITTGTDNALRGPAAILDRPNLVGDPRVATPTVDRWFNPAAFARAPVGSYGDVGRGTLRGPGQWNLDMALTRSFALRGARRLEARIESFNVLNHTRLGNPGTVLSNTTTFGKITSALDPRVMQLAAKFIF